MKKIIITLAFVAVAQFAFSQDDAYKKEVLKVVEKSPIGSQLTMIKDQIIGQVPADKQAAFIIEFDASINDLKDKLAPVYAETFTKEDIKAMNAFYEGPVGKKMSENEKSLMEKSQTIAKTWGEGLQAMMMKYMQ